MINNHNNNKPQQRAWDEEFTSVSHPHPNASSRGGSPTPTLANAIASSKVLVVGAGGIGCELLKTLVQSGFEDIEVVDLDTIDVSNLNRQFLFRPKHVGQPKSTVAAEAVRGFNREAKIVAHHGNIKSSEFDLDFFRRFNIVINALDNVNARQHVNRLCLSADVPMIDAGTTGYLGQSMVIKKDETKCYDCEPKKEAAQRFPLCTIRSTPDRPVHCIVWAKELFKLLFGVMKESDLYDGEESSEPGKQQQQEEEIGASTETTTPNENEDPAQAEKAREILAAEKKVRTEIMRAVARFPPNQEILTPAELKAYSRRVFEAVFDVEIKMKLEMRDGYKGAKFKPAPLSYSHALTLTTESSPAGSSSSTLLESQYVWPISKCVAVFEDAIARVWTTRREEIGSLAFDKDDQLAMDFVTAASNLRCHIFGIERKSPFEVKGIAGNIIHAIATTNAIVAGLQVLEAIRLLNSVSSSRAVEGGEKSSSSSSSSSSTSTRKLTKDCRFTWVVRVPAGSGFLLQPVELEPPLPTCPVCQRARLFVSLDLDAFTLGDFIKRVLMKALGVNEPTVLLGAGILYETGSDLSRSEVAEYAKKAGARLRDLGVASGAEMVVSDFSQGDMEMNIILTHVEGGFDEKDNPEGYEISGKRADPTKKKRAASEMTDDVKTKGDLPPRKEIKVEKTENGGECVVLSDDEEAPTATTSKRDLHDDDDVCVIED